MEVTVTAGGARVIVTPFGWDAALSITCNSTPGGGADFHKDAGPEFVNIPSTGDDVCVASVSGRLRGGGASYTLSVV